MSLGQFLRDVLTKYQDKFPREAPGDQGFENQQAGWQRRPKLPNWLIILSGIHCYCGVPLLSLPYAVSDGGWRSMIFLLVFFIAAVFTSYLLGLCFTNQNNLETFEDVGYAAFGIYGRYAGLIMSIVYTYASCVESVIVVREVLVFVFPKELLTVTEHGITAGSIVTYVIVVIILVIVSSWRPDIFHQKLTIAGIAMTLSVTIALMLHWLEIGDKYKAESEVFFNPPTIIMTIGLFAYCFSGHVNLPELYASMNDQAQYNEFLAYFFIPSLIIYAAVAVIGYAMFRAQVNPLFILSMKKNRATTYIAIICTVIHQVIRYILGVCSMARTVAQLARNPNNTNEENRILSTILIILLVLTTIPVSIVIPFYGLFMAFLGSFLGTLTALVVPCICYIRICWGQVTTPLAVPCFLIILLGLIAAGFGMVKSILEMVKAA